MASFAYHLLRRSPIVLIIRARLQTERLFSSPAVEPCWAVCPSQKRFWTSWPAGAKYRGGDGFWQRSTMRGTIALRPRPVPGFCSQFDQNEAYSWSQMGSVVMVSPLTHPLRRLALSFGLL